MKDVNLIETLKYANLSEQDAKSVVERILQLERKEILNNHKSKISYDKKRNLWNTRIDGKKVRRRNRKDLEDVIVQHYKKDEKTLCDIFDKYLTRRKLMVSSNTWSKEITYFEKYLKNSDLGKKAINNITIQDGYDFVTHCLSIKPIMKKKYWNCIKGFLNQLMQYCIDMQYINTNPFENLKPKSNLFTKTLTRDSDRIFSDEERIKVIQNAYEDAEITKTGIPLGIVLLFLLGLRIAELCGLKWKDIEEVPEGMYIHIQRNVIENKDEDTGKCCGFKVCERTKTPAGDRRIPLTNEVIYVLKEIKKYNELNNLPTNLDSFILMRTYNNNKTFCTERSFESRLKRYEKKAGMLKMKRLHDIRRTFVTNLYSKGMPLNDIRRIAGHSSIDQTMDYIKITEDDISNKEYLEALSVGKGGQKVNKLQEKEKAENPLVIGFSA